MAEIEWQQAGAVVARLVDGDGEPLQDAEVYCSLDTLRNGPNAAIWAPHPGKVSNPTTIPVADDGSVRFSGLVPGRTYTAWVSAPGQMKGVKQMMGIGKAFDGLTITPGETRDLGDIRPTHDHKPTAGQTPATKKPAEGSTNRAKVDSGDQDDAAIEFAGVVVDPDGVPVEGASLFVSNHAGQASGLLTADTEPVARTDSEGRFRFGAEAFAGSIEVGNLGFFNLIASKPGYGFA